jgi:hypothetical protein
MRRSLRRIACGLAIGGAILAAGFAMPHDAKASCDPSYPNECIAPPADVGDLDCAQIGHAVTVVHDPSIGAYDPHGLDADFDGIGCESY